jgi:hypothetical protein
MNRMDTTSEAPLLSSTATFYPSNNGPLSLKRLSLCNAVTDLCGIGDSCLPASSFHCPSDYTAADLSEITAQGSYSFTVDSIKIVPPSCDDPQAQGYTKSGNTVLVSSSCPMETLPDVNDPSLTQTQPPDTPCSTCTVVPDRPAVVGMLASLAPSLDELPSVESDAPKSYGLAAALDPDWLAQAAQNTISSAILVVECKTDPAIKVRLDVTDQFKALLPSSPTPLNSVRISFGTLEGHTNLVGCTASVDFKLNVAGTPTERSVQNAVYVDP